MPLHQVALDLLKQTGPLAVSSAKSAAPGPMPATAAEAEAQLGDSVAVYLDGGPCPGEPSTIVDLTGSVPRLLRAGVITVDRLRDVILVAEVDDPAADEPADAGDEPAGAAAEGAASAVPEEAGAEPAEASESAEASEPAEAIESDGTAEPAALPAEPEPAPDTAGGAAGDTPGRGRDAGPGPTALNPAADRQAGTLGCAG